MEKVTKKQYLSVIRRTVTVNSFLEQYFLRIIVVYLLYKNVTPWIAVSIPVVVEFARAICRGIKPLCYFAIKVNFKRFNFLYLVLFILLGFVISRCSSVYAIYSFCIILGGLTGLKNSTVTKLDTEHPEFESYCFLEEERSFTIGGTLGLITSQVLYDINPILYIMGFFVFGFIGIIINIGLKNISFEDNDSYESIDLSDELTNCEKKNIYVISILFAILAGLWCIGINGLEELAPLITTKTGYATSIYTFIELIALFVISGSIIDKLKSKKKLLLSETIIAILDILYLLIVAIFQNFGSLIFVYILCGLSSTLGDPLWGSIISSYSLNNRKKYLLINNIYFFVRAIFTFISWLVCRWCVINGVTTFRYLAITLCILVIITFIIANKVNKKVFNCSI